MLYVDYKKAFYLIDRSSLSLKLITVGVKGKIFKVVYSMCANAKFCVRKNGKFSKMFDCQIGVRQGGNLSPLLFAIFLNDFKFHNYEPPLCWHSSCSSIYGKVCRY